jgi:hypothetical protein
MNSEYRPGRISARRRAVRLLAPVGVAALLAASCGSDADPAAVEDESVDEVVEEASDAADDAADEAADVAESGDVSEDAVEFAEDQVDALEEMQDAQGGGSATLVVGDDEWTFDSVLCAFGEEEIGQEGAEFVLSGLQDGLQVYVSIDSFGHTVSLDDIEDFENPSVSLSSVGDDFILVDGTSISAAAEFVDYTGDDLSETSGTLEATCP